MSTTPVVPAPVSTVTKIEKDLTWVKLHVFTVLFLTGTLVGSGLYGFNKFEDLMEKHDAQVAAEQLQKEGVDTATQTALLVQLQKQQSANEARDAEAMATIQSLAQQIQASRAQTDKQVANDATLDLKSAAQRLATQTNSGDVSIVNGDVAMSLPLTRTVIADLDLLPQAQRDVVSLQGELTAETTVATDAKGQLDTATQVIAADKTELIATIKADDAACKVQVDAQASKDRKRGFWATLAGFVGGVLVGSRI